MLQLLWIETVLKLSGGLALSLAPLLVIKVLGLPPATSALLAAPSRRASHRSRRRDLAQGASPDARALGLAGCIVINLTSAAMITVLAMLGAGAGTRRGTAALWALVVILVVLSLFEIAHV